MRRALELAGTPGVPLGPNPRVGCVLLDPDGTEVAEGYHRGAGTPHAEAAALRARPGDAARRYDGRGHPRAVRPHRPHGSVLAGADRGRRGARGLRAAGPEPGGAGRRGGAAGGRRRRRLRPAGAGGARAEPGVDLRAWSTAGRSSPGSSPTTLDGRSAAADGSSRWITGEAARRDVHRAPGPVRRDPRRHGDRRARRPPAHRARRGRRTGRARAAAAARGDGRARARRPTAASSTTRPRPCSCAPTTPAAVLDELHARGRQHLFLEGGPDRRRRLPARRPGRRGGRLRRAQAARRGTERRGRPATSSPSRSPGPRAARRHPAR